MRKAMNSSVLRFIETLGQRKSGVITEVCIAVGTYYAKVGYFSDANQAAKALAHYDGKQNIYLSLNPVKRDLLARANNRLMPVGRNQNTKNRTNDDEALCDSLFLIDIDPCRPSGISSTIGEVEAALDVLHNLHQFLLNAGIPRESILTAMSGNGAYILIRLPDYEITPERTELKKRWLNHLS